MKAKFYYLENDMIRSNAIAEISRLKCDGKIKVTISNAGSKSSKQRGLQWRWYTDIAQSGKGDADNPNDVDSRCKWMFARPIFCRDDDFFMDLHDEFMRIYEGDSDRLRWFADHVIHTEQFNTSQMAEYLDMIERYYAPKGVELTDPRECGLK